MSNVLYERVEKELVGSDVSTVLCQSIGQCLPVSITWMVATEIRTLQGQFVEVNESCAHMALDDGQEQGELPEAHAEAHVEFIAEGARYSFVCWGFDIDASGHRAVSIRLPSTVHVVERRRSPRRNLRRTCHVTLRTDSWQDEERAVAALLNLSAHGVAVSISDRPDWLRKDSAVQVQLGPDAGIPDMGLKATVVSITEAGEVDRWIVGMEFVEDAIYAALLPALKQAIEE